MVEAWIRAIGAGRRYDMCNVQGRELRFVQSSSRSGDGECDAVFEEYAAELADCGGAVHVSQGMVDGADCRVSVDSRVVVYHADFGHSGNLVSEFM